MQLDQLIKDELSNLKSQLDAQISDPQEKIALMQMSNDLALLPIRMARGEDVTIAVNNLKAEMALRGVKHSLKAQTLVQQAWLNIVFKIIGVAVAAAI